MRVESDSLAVACANLTVHTADAESGCAAIIQHTRDHTTLGELAAGEHVADEAVREQAGFACSVVTSCAPSGITIEGQATEPEPCFAPHRSSVTIESFLRLARARPSTWALPRGERAEPGIAHAWDAWYSAHGIASRM